MIFKSKEKLSGGVEWLIVGLGNPGREYEATRHNAGFMALELLAEKENIKIDRLKFKSLLTRCEIGKKSCIVMKPQTFMNNSGEAVRDCAAFYKIPPEKVLVIFDDITLDLGTLRIRRKGTDGGHNGIKSIIYHLGSDNFPRIKIGVGKKPHPDYDVVAWVLSRFTEKEYKELLPALENAGEAAKIILGGDINGAMNKYNS